MNYTSRLNMILMGFCTVALLFFSETGRCHSIGLKDESETGDSEYVTKEIGYGELYEIRLDSVEDMDWAPEKARPGPAWRRARRRLPMGRDLVFRALGEKRDFRVELFLELVEVWTHDAEISGAKAGNAETDDRSYRGGGMIYECKQGTDDCELYADVKRASVTFFEVFGEHVFHALIRTDEEEFNVDPRYFVEKEKFVNGRKFPQKGSALSKLEAEMYFFCTSDFYEVTTDRQDHVKWTPKRRLLQTIDYWNNCYPGQNKETTTFRISVGMLIDDGFYAVAGNDPQTVQNYVVGMFNDINTMYVGQMSVELGLRNLVLGDIDGFNAQTFNEAPTQPGAKTCPSGMSPSARLAELRIWRGTYAPQINGLWHLQTHCHPPPGTVGVAYVGALCQSFGVGVNSWLGASRSWTVVAHEAGHNFGSGHTFDKAVNGQRAVGGIMDYGDGLLNGVYQFHPAHKNEVCNEISQSMTQQRAVPACWQALSNETPPAVTPDPTSNPTPAPVDPTPDPTQAPLPTPQPTTTVVNAPAPPAPAANKFYKWEVRTTRWSECSSSCGPGIQTQVVQCRGIDLTQCPSNLNYTPQDIATCSTTPLENFCPSQVVADTLCSAGCRPTSQARACGQSNSCPANMCGNGMLDIGEKCDSGLDACCLNCATGAWSTSADCINTNPTVDAAVMDYNERLYLFQGPQIAAFSDWDSNRIAAGFPMPLSAIRGLAPAFQAGIDSAASFYDSLVFLFKGLEFVMVDLDEMAQTSTVRDAVQYFALNQDLINCGKIDAIISYYWTLELMCGGIVSEFRWNVATFEAEVVNQKWRKMNLVFPVSHGGGEVSAAVRNPVDGKIRFYKGGQHSTLSTNDDAVAGFNPQFPGPAAGFETSACLVQNCKKCENAICKRCNSDYALKNQGKSCQHKSTFLSITFDDGNSWGSTLSEMVRGSETGAVDNGGFETGIVTSQGLFGNGGELDGRTPIKLQDVDFGSVVQSWRVSFWWKPTELKKERFLTITNGDENNCPGATKGVDGCNQFTIDFVHTSRTENIIGPTFAIELRMFGDFLDCYIDNGKMGEDAAQRPETTRAIKLNEWNKISIEFDQGKVITTANGLKHTVEMASEGIGARNLGVQFKDWEIGAAEDGLSGTIDKFEVTNLVPGATPKHSRPLWFKITIGGLVAAFVLFIGFIVYKLKHRKSQDSTGNFKSVKSTTSMMGTTATGSTEMTDPRKENGRVARPPPPPGLPQRPRGAAPIAVI